MFLDRETFRSVLDATPLVSLNLVVENHVGQFLLALPENRPARGFWFVPEGRIRKEEWLAKTFYRLLDDEIGCTAGRIDCDMLGLYEHFYDDSVFGDKPSAHYVVIAWHIHVNSSELDLPAGQHAWFRWWNRQDILENDDVHLNSLAFIARIESNSAQ